MASIKICDLCSSEFNLSADSESFLDELNESDLASINGGIIPFLVIGILLLSTTKAY
jgi:lactobin A/cerein 7B family class IIb bacteriocin